MVKGRTQSIFWVSEKIIKIKFIQKLYVIISIVWKTVNKTPY